MGGLTIDQYRSIQREFVLRNPSDRYGNDPNDRKVRMFVDPYFIQTCKEYGEQNCGSYRFLIQMGLVPQVKYQIGGRYEPLLFARIRIVVQRSLISLALAIMARIGPAERRGEYQGMLEMHRSIGSGAFLHLKAIESTSVNPGAWKWFSSLLNFGFSNPNEWDKLWLAHCDKVTTLAYHLGGAAKHESLQGPEAKLSELNSIGLYYTLNGLRTQFIDLCEWACGSTPASFPRGSNEAYAFFDRMEPLSADGKS